MSRGHDGVAVDDNALWELVRRGDADAYARVFEEHASAIYNYCFRRTADWAAAEDLLSIVFLEAWRRRDARLEPGKVLPWLYGIATNVVRNQRRSQRRHAAALARLPRPVHEEPFAERVAAQVDDEKQLRRLLEALNRLPSRERDVFLLCGWSGLGYDEAATALGIPVGTVRSRLSRARTRLRELARVAGHVDGRTASEQEVFEG